MNEEALRVEATGETIGEAKWSALRELEKLHPELDKSAVKFQVVTEGERGLLGVGYAPARVIASVDPGAIVEQGEPESELAARVREVLERITDGLSLRCRIQIVEEEELVTASLSGANLGLLIGKHGQTIDAIQYLTNAILWRAMPEALAVRSAEDALASHSPVSLEPMTAVERKVVHLRLKEFDGIETSSEGTEPNRFVVVSPTA
jgi:spoIIIJ-associated protein